jgi:hypothetical protein
MPDNYEKVWAILDKEGITIVITYVNKDDPTDVVDMEFYTNYQAAVNAMSWLTPEQLEMSGAHVAEVAVA